MHRGLGLILAGVSPMVATTAAAVRPNIVFSHGGRSGPGWVDLDGSNIEINTPNLERLTRDGMLFDRACPGQ